MGSSCSITESRAKGRVSWDQTWTKLGAMPGNHLEEQKHASKGSEQDIGKQPTKEVYFSMYVKSYILP